MAKLQMTPLEMTGYCKDCGLPNHRCKEYVALQRERAELSMNGTLSLVDKASIAAREGKAL